MEKKLKIIKRSGEEVLFNVEKIEHAISGANKEVVEDERLTNEQIIEIGKNIEKLASESLFMYTVEDIQDLVETQIMNYALLDADKVTTAFVEAGGLYPEYVNNQNIDQIEKNMNAANYKCERLR